MDRRTEREQRIVRTLDTRRDVGWIEDHLFDGFLIFMLSQHGEDAGFESRPRLRPRPRLIVRWVSVFGELKDQVPSHRFTPHALPHVVNQKLLWTAGSLGWCENAFVGHR